MTRSPLFNFALGIFFGVLAGAAGAAHVCANHAQRHAEEIGQSFDRLNQHISEVEKKAEELQSRAQACETVFAEKMRADSAGSKAAEMDKWQRDFRDRWYTLVYEPGAPEDDARMQGMVLNFVHPGLGTLVSRLQAAQAPPGLRLRYILHGYVEAEATPQGVHLVRTLVRPEVSQSGAVVQ
jgi:hypothetical protein